ncbi:MAG: 50S ribosomal protein L3 [Nitrospinota bacterium]
MVSEIVGKKIGMTQMFDDKGDLLPVTLIQAGPCEIVQVKTVANEGYDSVQLGFGVRKKGKVNKPLGGHLKKNSAKPCSLMREVRTNGEAVNSDSKTVDVTMFKSGDSVDVTGVTIGRGFAGVLKRYNMAGAPASRGSHENFRHVGSLAGGSSNATRVWPGKRLPGRMGGQKRTVLNLEIVKIIEESNHIAVKGAIPGSNGTIVMVRKSNRK